MELKNIFKMTKTDRYTQDGRDELAKLQETEDVKYKTGDISQKTGLQKQPDGSWAPPKKGGAAPKMGSPEYNKKYGLTKKDVATGKEIDRIYEKHQKRIKELKAKGYTDEQIENDKIYQQTKEDMRNVGKSKPEEKSLAGTPMKKADLNSKDPYEITHSMKPDTASEAKEMDKISAFMQEETGATLRNAILARESFYKNTKNPTPEQQEGLAALMKIQQKLGYGKPAENKPAAEKPTEKYKDLPGAQKKDALYASTFEGSSIGMTQTSMERNGWDLVQADDDVNVYAKPDGSKVTMKHDGKRITSTEYEAPENKPAATKPNSTKIDTSAAQQKLDELTKNQASYEERSKVAEQIGAANEYNYLVENLEKRGTKPTEEMQKKLVELKAKAESKPAAAEANKNFERAFNNQPFNPTEGQTFTWEDSNGEETMGEVKSVGAKANAVSGFAQVVYEDIETGTPVHAVVQFDNQGKTKSVENVIKAKSEAEAREIFKRYTSDAAPRILTGDTKIRVRK